MSLDHGVEYVYPDGSSFIAWGWAEKAARAFVADHGGQPWHPRPSRVMRRTVGEPEAADEEPAA